MTLSPPLTGVAPAEPQLYYPESDGEPIGETDYHISVILYLRQALRHFFRHSEQVYVAADMLFYFEEGNPKVFKVPDVFVVKGISTHDRRVYKLWEEGVVPCTIFEITSKGTRWEDTGAKRGLYATLGVQEYILFDPLDEYLSPRLQGFALKEQAYHPIPLSSDGTLHSETLGAILRPEDKMLRVIDPTTGETMPTLAEAVDLALRETERAKVEAQRADTAEAEVARLQAELARLRGEGA